MPLKKNREIKAVKSLLNAAARGEFTTVQALLKAKKENKLSLNINSKGKKKRNLWWTAFHLASYFGHKDIAEALLHAGAKINETDDAGDTALHKAASAGNKELVILLLDHSADINIKNGMGKTAADVCKSRDVLELLQTKSEAQERDRGQELSSDAKQDPADAVQPSTSKTMPDEHIANSNHNLSTEPVTVEAIKINNSSKIPDSVKNALRTASISLKVFNQELEECRAFVAELSDSNGIPLPGYNSLYTPLQQIHKLGTEALNNIHLSVLAWERDHAKIEAADKRIKELQKAIEDFKIKHDEEIAKRKKQKKSSQNEWKVKFFINSEDSDDDDVGLVTDVSTKQTARRTEYRY